MTRQAGWLYWLDSGFPDPRCKDGRSCLTGRAVTCTKLTSHKNALGNVK